THYQTENEEQPERRGNYIKIITKHVQVVALVFILWLKQREENGYANTAAGQRDDQPVYAHHESAVREYTRILLSHAVVIQLHSLFIASSCSLRLGCQAFALNNRVNEFRERGTNFVTIDDQIPGFNHAWVVAVWTSERLSCLRVVVNKGRLDDMRFDQFVK